MHKTLVLIIFAKDLKIFLCEIKLSSGFLFKKFPANSSCDQTIRLLFLEPYIIILGLLLCHFLSHVLCLSLVRTQLTLFLYCNLILSALYCMQTFNVLIFYTLTFLCVKNVSVCVNVHYWNVLNSYLSKKAIY